jgi:Sulfotransferase family
MPRFPRRLLHRFIPSHFHDPVGLARRLLRTGDSAALFAIESALLGLIATPLDLLLQPVEQRRYRKAPNPGLPLLVICGAPRTGTTLIEQVLIRYLPFAFINNLTAVFPRSPLTANRIFQPAREVREDSFHSYYGKTVGFAGPNDGLHLWDRWLGSDRTKVRTVLTPTEQRNMRRFFGAMEQLYSKPILAKNNNLNACAALVAEVLDHAFFICMTRDPRFLAQSQLQARLDIHGRSDMPYGLSLELEPGGSSLTAIENVCRQILFHQQLAREQQKRIGPERFWIVEYESFCQNPSGLVEAVANKVLGQPCPADARQLPPFTVSNAVRIDHEHFREIELTLTRLTQSTPPRYDRAV